MEREGQFWVQISLGPLEKSLKIAEYDILASGKISSLINKS
jgi:hypothetical protein